MTMFTLTAIAADLQRRLGDNVRVSADETGRKIIAQHYSATTDKFAVRYAQFGLARGSNNIDYTLDPTTSKDGAFGSNLHDAIWYVKAETDREGQLNASISKAV